MWFNLGMLKYEPVVKPVKLCEKCHEATWRGARLCVNCKRKPRILIRCAFMDCPETFLKTGKNKFCLNHRSLDARRRELKEKVTEGKISREIAIAQHHELYGKKAVYKGLEPAILDCAKTTL
jgi:hypothetical protein